MLSIFGFTALMDFHSWAPLFEISRGLVGLMFLAYPQNQFVAESNPIAFGLMGVYGIVTVGIGFWAKNQSPKRSLVLN